MKNEEVYVFAGQAGPVGLHAFYNFPRANKRQRGLVCNGAGPRRFGRLVPDAFWGLCITESADNHDWDYQWGETIEDKRQADRTFKNNMLRQAEALRLREAAGNPGWIKRRVNEYRHQMRLDMVEEYYKAVDSFGGPAFWDKEKVGFSWTDVPAPSCA